MPTHVRSTPLLSDKGTATKRKMVGRVGAWQLVQLLAETNLSRLYAARPVEADHSQPPSYALKMLRKEWWRDPHAIELFRREAWVGSRVSHPHVVPILAANVKQPPIFLAMPLLQGQTLRDHLDAGWSPTAAEVLWIARQVVEGLIGIRDTVNTNHGDIKPENILLSQNGHATLIDLGFAKSPEECASVDTREIMGSFAYVAPELVTSLYAGNAQSDLYSLGVMLYELLAGQRPFESSDPAELIAMHRGQKPAHLRTLRPDLPKPVASLVHTLLAKDPLRRGKSLDELPEQLIRLEIDCFAIREVA